MDNEKTTTDDKNFLVKKYATVFGRELLEAFAILFLINIFHLLSAHFSSQKAQNTGVSQQISSAPKSWKDIPWGNMFIWTLILGIITTLAVILDPDMHGKIKDSMKNSIGGVVMASAISRAM